MCCSQIQDTHKGPQFFSVNLPHIIFLTGVFICMFPHQKDTLLLDRCILEETKRDIDRRHEEELIHLRAEFQLEASAMRKKRREVCISIESLSWSPFALTAVVSYVVLNKRQLQEC